MAERLRFLPAGENAFLVELSDLAMTLTLLDGLRAARLEGIVDVIPGARTLMVRFDPLIADRANLATAISRIDLSTPAARTGTTFDIPVVYDGEDVGDVAKILGCSIKEVIRRHTAVTYTVAFTGFAPGFVYMTCDDPTFDVPRRKSPRVRVPAGSVALGGKFCGFYPFETPGGWQLLGRTPEKMWDPTRAKSALLAPGDRVRFHAMAKGTVAFPCAETARPAARSAPGLLVTRADRSALYEDGGRPGRADQGVGVAGALDTASFVQANVCVGNPPDAAALEITFGGFALKTDRPITLAVTGAPAPLAIRSADARRSWAPFARPFELQAGDELALEAPSSGLRSYLALRGGFKVESVLGSASTHTLARVGPAPVVLGDILVPAGAPSGELDPAPPRLIRMPKPGETVTLDVVLGPRTDWFTPESIATLFAQDWKVTPDSNRIGLRLAGAKALEKCTGAELPSEATVVGSIQVPHNGQPVLFLADHPLTGGYPVIGVVARHHLDLAGQIPGGAKVRFNPVTAFAPFVKE